MSGTEISERRGWRCAECGRVTDRVQNGAARRRTLVSNPVADSAALPFGPRAPTLARRDGYARSRRESAPGAGAYGVIESGLYTDLYC